MVHAIALHGQRYTQNTQNTLKDKTNIQRYYFIYLSSNTVDNILNIGTKFNFLHALCPALGSKLSKSVDKVEESMCIALNHVD